jgi:hypothetical protein
MAGNDTRINAGVFEPEDVANLRSGLDRAWNALPFERRTMVNMDILAAEIVRVATLGEHDPVRLADHALKAIMPEVVSGAL